MKKNLSFLFILVVLSIALILGGCGQEDDSSDLSGEIDVEVGENIELNFVSSYADAHPTTINGFMAWMDEVEGISDGQLKIHNFAPETLCPEKEIYDSITGGFVDMGGAFTAYYPGKFRYTEVMDLPLIVKSAESGSLVMMELIETFPEIKQEYNEVELLWMWTSATYNIHTVDKEVKTLNDLKGMRIIGWSPKVLQMIKLLGGNPIEMAGLDTYMALERGMADGVLCPLAPIRSYKISDIAKYHTVIDLAVGPFCAAMNQETYDNLPDNLRQIIDETTGVKMAQKCGITLDEGAVEDSNWMLENGHEFYVIPDDERELWIEAISPMWDEWVKDLAESGYNKAREILETAVELGKKYDKVTGRGYAQ